MNCMVIWIIQFLLNMNLSFAEFFVMTPSSVSQRKLLLTLKTQFITECLLKCKNTAGCKYVATAEDQDKISFECYLIASNKISHDGDERFLKVNKLNSITVSLFTLMFLFYESLKWRKCFMSSKNERMFEWLANILIKINFKRPIFWNIQKSCFQQKLDHLKLNSKFYLVNILVHVNWIIYQPRGIFRRLSIYLRWSFLQK